MKRDRVGLGPSGSSSLAPSVHMVAEAFIHVIVMAGFACVEHGPRAMARVDAATCVTEAWL